jgi:hypothetical protein
VNELLFLQSGPAAAGAIQQQAAQAQSRIRYMYQNAIQDSYAHLPTPRTRLTADPGEGPAYEAVSQVYLLVYSDA